MFAARGRQRQISRQADGGRDGLVDQLVEAGGTDGGQHLGHFSGAGADVTFDELVVLLQGAQGQGLHVDCFSRGLCSGTARPLTVDRAGGGKTAGRDQAASATAW